MTYLVAYPVAMIMARRLDTKQTDVYRTACLMKDCATGPRRHRFWSRPAAVGLGVYDTPYRNGCLLLSDGKPERHWSLEIGTFPDLRVRNHVQAGR